eukprot:2344819-Pyramimonas_sp.AAC.1
MYTDCANVYTQTNRPLADQLHYQRPYAGLLLHGQRVAHDIGYAKKVKAQFSLDEEGVPVEEMQLRRGNSQADETAKAGARLHAEPSADQSQAIDGVLIVAGTVCKLAAALLFKWPRLV